MGNFEVDTRVVGEAGRYTASLSDDWAIWGPNGGYIASMALRAAGVESVFDRPASFQCQFLSAGRFDEVQIDVRSIRSGRNAEALGATIRQGEKTLLEAFVWTVPEADPALNGMEHDFSPAPKVPPASELTPVSVLQARHGLETRRFWENFERWPVNWTPPDEKQAGPPSFDCWYRFEPMARFDCPFTDAARSLLLIDTNGWPAAYGPHIEEQPLIAPSLDVAVQFHRDARESDLLLGEFEAPIATEAMIGTRGRVWDESGRLVASGGSQLLQRSRTPGARLMSSGTDADDLEGRAEHETRRFVERVVIGLGLCPFARVPWEAGRIDIVVSAAVTEAELIDDLAAQVDRLVETPAEALETALLVHPRVLETFETYNAFLYVADSLLTARGLEGVLQIASFHPDYQFAGAPEDDPANATNRSPWPMLHLLREASITEAVDSHPDAAEIPDRNIETLRGLGAREVRALLDGLRDDPGSVGS